MYSTAVNQVIIKEIKTVRRSSAIQNRTPTTRRQFDRSILDSLEFSALLNWPLWPTSVSTRRTVSRPAWAHHAQPVTGERTRRTEADRGR